MRTHPRILGSIASSLAVLGLGLSAHARFAPPRGIYVVSVAADNPNTPTDERLAAIRDYDFVSGYTLRVFWKDIEPTQGAYNFAVIDEAISRVAAIGQRMNLEVLQALPTYLIDGAAETYIDHRDEISPVPWDAFAQSRYAALQQALATHNVNDGTGLNLPLNAHPVLASVDASSVGLNFGVRDLNNGIRSHPSYTQAAYIGSVAQGVNAARTQFPNHEGFLAFFAFTDGQPGTPVDQQLINVLGASYNGPGQPPLSFFIENLSDTGPVPIGASGGTGNNLKAWNARGGHVMMQALDSWLAHRPDRDAQLASLNAATGIALGYQNYATRFFELYVSDLDGAVNGAVDASGRSILNDLRQWDKVLTVCTTDFDVDGHVGSADLFMYLDAWFAQTAAGGRPAGPSADFDRDGEVSVLDLFGFLDGWFEQLAACG